MITTMACRRDDDASRDMPLIHSRGHGNAAFKLGKASTATLLTERGDMSRGSGFRHADDMQRHRHLLMGTYRSIKSRAMLPPRKVRQRLAFLTCSRSAADKRHERKVYDAVYTMSRALSTDFLLKVFAHLFQQVKQRGRLYHASI